MPECQHIALIAVLTDRCHISVFVALSALGNVMTVTFAQARVNQELAKEGVVPFGRFWAFQNGRTAPPLYSIVHHLSRDTIW